MSDHSGQSLSAREMVRAMPIGAALVSSLSLVSIALYQFPRLKDHRQPLHDHQVQLRGLVLKVKMDLGD